MLTLPSRQANVASVLASLLLASIISRSDQNAYGLNGLNVYLLFACGMSVCPVCYVIVSVSNVLCVQCERII